MKNIINLIKSYMPFIIELIFCILILSTKLDIKIKIIFIIWMLYIIYINIKNTYYVLFHTKAQRQLISNSGRVIEFIGAQGAGKTSSMLHMAKYLSKNDASLIYSLIPFKINGEYVNQLTLNHLDLKERLPEGSIIVIDEITLIYNNQERLKQSLLAFRQHLQMIRHFYDGYCLWASVDADQTNNKQLRNFVSLTIQSLNQNHVPGSLFIHKIICIIFKKDVYKYGYRIWNSQVFRNVPDIENYTINIDSNQKNNDYAPLILQANLSSSNIIYEDRIFKYIYQQLKQTKTIKWNSLYLYMEDLKEKGYIDIYNIIYKNKQNSPNESHDSISVHDSELPPPTRA